MEYFFCKAERWLEDMTMKYANAGTMDGSQQHLPFWAWITRMNVRSRRVDAVIIEAGHWYHC